MVLSDLVDISLYAKKYHLKKEVVGLTRIHWPQLDLDEPGLIMHGSEADPYTILKYGLVPQQNPDAVDNDWQVCLGLNAKSRDITLMKHHSRKNSAVKYCGYFSSKGVLYVLSDKVKNIEGYSEFWDEGEGGRGYAWVMQPIPPHIITALVTENIALAAAALVASGVDKLIFRPGGKAYHVEALE